MKARLESNNVGQTLILAADPPIFIQNDGQEHIALQQDDSLVYFPVSEIPLLIQGLELVRAVMQSK